MINYDLIKNPELRLLIAASESIQSLPEDQIQAMVERVASTSEAGQMELIAALKDEQNQVRAAKLARGITPEIEQKKLEEASIQMTGIVKKLDTDVRVEHEKTERTQTNTAAEMLIQQLDTSVPAEPAKKQ